MKHAELVAFRVRKHLEALVTALADIGPSSTEAEQSFDLVSRLGGTKIDVAALFADLLRRTCCSQNVGSPPDGGFSRIEHPSASPKPDVPYRDRLVYQPPCH